MAKEPTRISNSSTLVEQVEQKIYLIRGHKVMLDSDLAKLYGVQTKSLNLAVKRNQDRFPEDFCFQLSKEEAKNLIFQFGISKGEGNLRFQFETSSYGGRRYLPHAFTEQGVAMLSSVLRSKRAVLVNVAIMRTFVKLRQMLATHKDLAQRLDQLEQKYDSQFRVVFEAIRQLMKPPDQPKRRIGFHP